jgi:hypothetical protein
MRRLQLRRGCVEIGRGRGDPGAGQSVPRTAIRMSKSGTSLQGANPRSKDATPWSRGADRARVTPRTLALDEGGRRECRMQAAPMARLQQKTQAAVTTGPAGTTGIPWAMVLTAAPRSLRSPGLLASVALGSSSKARCQRRGIRTTRLCRPPQAALVFAAKSVHRIPHPTSVTIAIRPSDGCRTAGTYI